MNASPIAIHRVTTTGSVERLGQYEPSARRLRIERLGYPLLGVGVHEVGDEDIPWVFQDMAPAGFIGHRFSRWFEELALPPRPIDWSAEDTLRAVSRAGHDLAGNLLIGDDSLERYRRIFEQSAAPGPSPSAAEAQFDALAERSLDESFGLSSLGGERPKFTLRLSDRSGWLVKFSPPVDAPFGQRWSDLLHAEMHAANTLRAFAIPAVSARITGGRRRTFLVLDRFDRIQGGGRVGCVSWYGVAGSRYGIVNAARTAEVARALRRDGIIDEAELRRFELAHAFSAAIGNNDTHLGNYSLVLDEDGRTKLAPMYDVVPMALAPRNDELPDARLRPTPRSDDAEVRSMVSALFAVVEADERVSRPFVALWRSLLRANL